MKKFSKPLALRPDPHAARAQPETVMLLAAGLGKRMRPLTATRPKPLVEVAGRSLLDHALDRVRAGGVRRAVVNVHYLADALEAHLRNHADGLEILVSNERAQLLETGGGVVHALPLLGDQPFYVVNTDNLWVDGPVDTLRLLANGWDDERMDALLLVVPLAHATAHGGQGDFHMDAAGHLRRREPRRVAPFVYTGIQLVSPRLFRDAPGGPFSMNILWNRAMQEGRVFGVVHQGLWCDVGTPAAIPVAESMLRRG
ncbi:nucleotidyltransferase family protein [Sphingomonas oligoaromativorans]|jgi:MurNAc alpha-1-phosphate uridylyltransferase|uniref:nucleotidyltransferase family protein n=1 Tax=Sphingomonas oligoaromativorans TaxID=575322 RepID=UPI001422F944|nr:nucleotidyltransferase family protein [Sphingomonas oligoaromativorans]NIJ33575.1 MurNAc alpha-1-phosphate uridylyltransferase [Sphingomonas oligoaromativorans]